MATRRYLTTTQEYIINNHDQIELYCRDRHCPVHNIGNAFRNSVDYESDEFRMYSFKVLMCHKTYSHDWTNCPYTHRGERARRRPPCRYLPIQCPYYKDDDLPIQCPYYKDDDPCKRESSCKLAHGIFEYWLHPGKYRTLMCTNGIRCNRKVCFFAHTPEELRPEIPIQSDERYLAFASNVEMPAVLPPRHAFRGNSKFTPGSHYLSKNTGPAPASTGIGFGTNISTSNGTYSFPRTSQNYGMKFGDGFVNTGGKRYDAILPNIGTNFYADTCGSYGANFGNVFPDAGITSVGGEFNTNYDPILANTGLNYAGQNAKMNSRGASTSSTRYVAATGAGTTNFTNFGTPSSSTFTSSLSESSSSRYNFSGMNSVLKEIEEQGTTASAENNGYNPEEDVDWSHILPFDLDETELWK